MRISGVFIAFGEHGGQAIIVFVVAIKTVIFPAPSIEAEVHCPDVASFADEKRHIVTGPGIVITDLQQLDILDFAEKYKGETCYNDARVNGRPVGAIRVSLGYPATQEDVDKLIKVISDTFSE